MLKGKYAGWCTRSGMRHKKVLQRGQFARTVPTMRHWKLKSPLCNARVQSSCIPCNMLQRQVFPPGRVTRGRLSLQHVPTGCPQNMSPDVYQFFLAIGIVGFLFNYFFFFPASCKVPSLKLSFAFAIMKKIFPQHSFTCNDNLKSWLYKLTCKMLWKKLDTNCLSYGGNSSSRQRAK